MKLLAGKVKNPISDKKGEMLMEAIVSVLLLSILLVIITTMIQTSRNMTARSMRDASRLQEMELNLVARAAFEEFNTTPGDIRFYFVDTSAGIGINAEHDILIFDPDSFIEPGSLEPPSNIFAFFPEP